MNKFDDMMHLLIEENVAAYDDARVAYLLAHPGNDEDDFIASTDNPNGAGVSRQGSFGQVIVVDRKFELLERAWCVAEIAQATASNITPSLKVASSESINQNFEKIKQLDVGNCKASREEDKKDILFKINKKKGVDHFNGELRRIIGWIALDWMHKENEMRKENEERARAEIAQLKSQNTVLQDELKKGV